MINSQEAQVGLKLPVRSGIQVIKPTEIKTPGTIRHSGDKTD